MKITYRYIVLILISIGLFACDKEEKMEFNFADIWKCYHEMTWDSPKVRETLIGKWEWEYISCVSIPENDTIYIGLAIEFNADSTLNVIENGQASQTSNWEVVDGDGDLFELDVDPGVAQLYGRILICGDTVIFNSSYIDVCDNYFIRKD